MRATLGVTWTTTKKDRAVETLVLIVIALALGLLAGATLYIPLRRGDGRMA